jgi:flagella basal body P-ring formation protein FlgA
LITAAQAAVGKLTLAALPAGASLRPDMLRAPFAVAQGQQVRVLFQGEGFRVGSEGRALSSAAVGEAAQVRTASGKVVKGTVQAPGVVEVR